MMSRVRAGLGLVLTSLLLVACGRGPVADAATWQRNTLAFLDTRAFTVEFVLEFEPGEASPTRPPFLRAGRTEWQSPTQFRLEARTTIGAAPDDAAGPAPTLLETQLADGDTRWIQLRRDDEDVDAPWLARRLDGHREADDADGGAPLDLDALSLLRFLLQQASFTLGDSEDAQVIVLVAPVSPALQEALDAAGSSWRWSSLRLALDEESGLPMHLEARHEADGGALSIRFPGWSIGDIHPSRLQTPQ